MIAERRCSVVVKGRPSTCAWAPVAHFSKTKKSSVKGATRIELATAGSAILCSTAELHALAGHCAASARISLQAKFSFDWSGVRTHASEEKRT